MENLLLETGIQAVKEAEKIILNYFENKVQVDIKEDGSPVTIADKKAEELIRKIISSQFPNHGFIGEEFGSDTHKNEYIWVIDPIDGTKNYSRNIPMFATELALFKNDEIILGISNAPKLNKLLTAQKGKGTYLNQKTKLQVSSISKITEAYISVGSVKYFAKKPQFNRLAKVNEVCAAMKGFGDTWSYHFVAEGKLEAVIEAKTNIWDIAAASIIIEEAGGKVTDLDGEKLSINTKSALASNGLLHEDLLNYFK